MIERTNGCVEFECDQCGERFESDEEDFAPSWRAAKNNGWRSRKIGDEWVHACPDCRLNNL